MVVSDATAGVEWLIDKSALLRLGASAAAATWAERIQRGVVRIATVTLLEVGYAARDAVDLDGGLRGPPVGSMPIEHTTPIAEDRAVRVLTLLERVDTTAPRRCQTSSSPRSRRAPGSSSCTTTRTSIASRRSPVSLSSA
jgi:hypothetical protein